MLTCRVTISAPHPLPRISDYPYKTITHTRIYTKTLAQLGYYHLLSFCETLPSHHL